MMDLEEETLHSLDRSSHGVAQESLNSSGYPGLQSHTWGEPSGGKGGGGVSRSGQFIQLEEREGSEEGEEGGVEGTEDEDEDDREDRELLSELRELYKGMNSSIYINLSSESLSSSLTDDPEVLRTKIAQLQHNVNEWKDSYDALVNELRKLSLERVIEREEIRIRETNAKGLQQAVRRLESELKERLNLLSHAESMNKQLLQEVNSLRKERGMREVELNSFSVQLGALNEGKHQAMELEEDLRNVLQLIQRGIDEGLLKLSELEVVSQSVPFPLEDLSLGPCAHDSQMLRYKTELEGMREEVRSRISQLANLREEMAALQREHEATLEELEESRNCLELIRTEKKNLQEELAREREGNGELHTEVRLLEEQLEASQHREQSLDDSLISVNDSLRHVQDLTEQRLKVKEAELSQVRTELSEMEKRHQELEESVVASRRRVEGLERAEKEAQLRSEELQEELEEWKGKERKMAELSGEKDTLQRKLNGLSVELECQVKLAEQYKASLDTVQQLHCKCQEEMGKMRTQLLSKDTDLSRALTALQLTSSQISALQWRSGGRSPKSLSPRTTSPRTLPTEVSECEGAVQEVELELQAHRRQWEALHEASERDAVAISRLTASKEELELELTERRESVRHLEGLLEEVGSSHERLQGAVEDYEGRVLSVAEELEVTRSGYQEACEEIARLKERLLGMTVLQDQQQLLQQELEKREVQLQEVQESREGLKEAWQECQKRAEAAESAQELLEAEQVRIRGELAAQEGHVEQLEHEVAEERARREEDVGRVEQEMQQERATWKQEMETFSQELKAQSHDLEKERIRYLELKQVLEERDKTLQNLHSETDFLNKQYKYTKSEVEHSQQLVESLQEDLASSKGRCDGLQQAVDEYEQKVQDMSEELEATQQERLALQDKVTVSAHELADLQSQLEASASRHTLLRTEEEEKVRLLTQQLATRDAELAHLTAEKTRVSLACAEEREAKEKLKVVIADLELQRDNLSHKLSSYETTIQTLKSQVSLTESSQHLREEERLEQEEKMASLLSQLAVLEGQLAVANDRILQQERAKAVVEMAGTERLEEIRNLTRELEEVRLRADTAEEAQGRVEQLERDLARKQEEISSAELKVEEAERSHADILHQLRKLEECLTESAEREGREEELQVVVEEQERELRQLRDQCVGMEEQQLVLQSEVQVAVEKEEHLRHEISGLSKELELSRQHVVQLEGDLGRSEEEVETLQGKLRSAQRMQDLAREEVSSGQHFEETLKKQLAEKRAQVLDLEKEVGKHHGEIATLKGKLLASENGKAYLQKRVDSLEKECDRLLLSQSEAEQELRTLEHTLEERVDMNRKLEEDCKSLTENLSAMSKGERSNSETLVERIREQDNRLASLKASLNDLEMRNEMLMQANSELKAQMNAVSVPVDDLPLASNSASSLNGASSINVNVNVNVSDITLPATTSTTTVTAGTSVASTTVPIRFDSQYRRAMESCQPPQPVEDMGQFPGSETESEAAALDKEYWIRRAGELSVQLQQSSEYWAQKVRELSIDLEKQRQAPRHVD